MQVRAKKYLGQHFLTDQEVARRIVASLDTAAVAQDVAQLSRPAGELAPQVDVLEVGPGMGVLTQYLLERTDISLRAVEIDEESVDYLREHFPGFTPHLYQEDFLELNLAKIYGPRPFCIIGNFPYNISSQIFFKVLDNVDSVPQVVCMVQKEVAERIASPAGNKSYGILSVLLQAWYDIEYLFTVGEGAFVPPPKVKSAVIRLRRNSRSDLGCDPAKFKAVVKTAFNQRRKTLRNSLRPLSENVPEQFSQLRPEQLSVEQFIELTSLLS
ncbi:MAG: 16S rRNA (adenine(1518)-N(6)/adenine(1519)-N(6))-dimethyltransferase RsmA [Bacteroidales bacterium]|nr:16S rRNA (adenine(1518)-N(6)/adenine(1519)-N(6))-dimethyltransferase RsmA [Bacteroidales bacterium]